MVALQAALPKARPSALEVAEEERDEPSEALLFTEVDWWMTGTNRNVAGTRRSVRHSGHPRFRERCEAVAAGGYPNLVSA